MKKNNKLFHVGLLSLLMNIPFVLHAQNYFQQEVNYTIHVRLNDTLHVLDAYEEIEYINNSPNTLEEVWFHLWPNAYKNNTTAFAKQKLENRSDRFYFSKEKERGYIDSLYFKVNGLAVKWEYDNDNIDVCKLILNKPQKSGEKIVITTPFKVKIPVGEFSRLGHEGQSYQITQWYPKPAVYDMNGWNAMPYLDQGEFYSEYGSFDVYITLPKNYVVGSTGDLVNSEDELQWLEAKAQQTKQITKYDKDLSFPLSSPEKKTLHYHQDNIHDFAWFADKRYHVLKGEVELPVSKRKVTTWTMFTNQEAELWKKSIEYINDAIYYYSLWNGEYPYNQATAVQGALSAGSGMEYPNITIIGKSYDAFVLEEVIMHEVGHNWFYGILGSDERKHPWMDEGINSFNESRYIQTKYPEATLISGYEPQASNTKMFDVNSFKHKSLYYLTYLYTALKHTDQPISLSSEQYNMMNYGAIVYSKSAAVFDYLRKYLGNSVFDKAMHAYYDQWKYKHPQPADLRNIFEENAGKDLSWFFDDVINTNKTIDYKITSCKKLPNNANQAGDYYNVKIKNKGDIAAPFSLSGIWNGKADSTKWFDGFTGEKVFTVNYINPQAVKIDAAMDIPEVNKKNNNIRTSGLFRKAQPLKLQFLVSVDNPDKMQLYWFPLLGWNHYDHLMPGLALYNNPLFQKKFDYVIAPMYSTGTGSLCGMADAGYNMFLKKSFIHDIRFGISAKQFSYSNEPYDLKYSRIVPSIDIKFRQKNARSSITQTLKIRNVNVFKNDLHYNLNSDSQYIPVKCDTSYMVNDFTYTLLNRRLINPYSIGADVQQAVNFLKASVEARYRITYNNKNSGFDIRFFAGGFLWKDLPSYFDFRYRMSGTSGGEDYLYDYTYLGRTDYSGVWQQQFTENDGGFKVATPIGDTWDWLAAINLKTSVPGKVPIKLFADIGTYKGAKDAFGGSKVLVFDAGVEVFIIRDIFEIYFPLAMSSDLKNYADGAYENYWQKIRFVLNIQKLDPFKAIKNINF